MIPTNGFQTGQYNQITCQTQVLSGLVTFLEELIEILATIQQQIQIFYLYLT